MCQKKEITAVELAACPFCAGAPAEIIRYETTQKPLTLGDALIPGWYEALVFCHECGAQSGEVSAEVHQPEDMELLIASSRVEWNLRDKRNQDLYASALSDGLIVAPVGADGWIPVSEQLPPYGVPVDVVCMGYVQHIAHKLAQDGEAFSWEICSEDHEELVELDAISHWRYRPEFPTAGATAKNQLVAAAVERDQYGHWTHPDFFEPADDREYGGPGEFEAWLESFNLECVALAMSEDDGIPDQDVVDWDAGQWDARNWNPTAPAGEGWFIGSIHDSEEGPFCVWLRAKERAKG